MLISVRVLMTLAARDFTSSLKRASGQAGGDGEEEAGLRAWWPCSRGPALPRHPSHPLFCACFSGIVPFSWLHDVFCDGGDAACNAWG